jgi:hypothetical protein
MRINKKVIILAINISLCALVFFPRLGFATWGSCSIVLVVGGDSEAMGNWDVASTYSTSRYRWGFKNDSGGREDIKIRIYSDTGAWTPDANPGLNKYVLKALRSDGTNLTLTTSDQILYSYVASYPNSYSTKYFGISFTTPTAGSEEGDHDITIRITASNWQFACGDKYRVQHTAGTVAPQTVLIDYQTVSTNLSGNTRCWIRQNLGAAAPATSYNDTSSSHQGWYWKFNQKQGYRWTGSTTNPAFPTSYISDDSDWVYWLDPCYKLLGSTKWHIPTYTEWFNADSGWGEDEDAFASVLKLHNAGYIVGTSGELMGLGSYGYQWCRTQKDSSEGYRLKYKYSSSSVWYTAKYYGFSVRCILDP